MPPAAARLIARPLTIASMRVRTVSVAWTRPIVAPVAMPAATPDSALPVATWTAIEASADASIVPSSAMFTTPLRSHRTPPSPAHA